MNAIARIPFWAWYLISVVYCYLIWNPYFSLYQLFASDVSIVGKIFAAAVALGVLSLYIAEGKRTLNWFAITLFTVIIASMLWFAMKLGIHGSGYVHLWGQWIMGLLLVIALRGSVVYRALTGRVSVSGDGDHG